MLARYYSCTKLISSTRSFEKIKNKNTKSRKLWGKFVFLALYDTFSEPCLMIQSPLLSVSTTLLRRSEFQEKRRRRRSRCSSRGGRPPRERTGSSPILEGGHERMARVGMAMHLQSCGDFLSFDGVLLLNATKCSR